VALTETLYLELAESAPHVGVTLLCPGATKSKIMTSSRNRPARFGSTGDEAPHQLRQLNRQNEMGRALIESGTDPEIIASSVIRAVRENQFYVLTHKAEYERAIRDRADQILSGGAPRLVDLESIISAQRVSGAG
jgi:short-subunit dehydrogenase